MLHVSIQYKVSQSIRQLPVIICLPLPPLLLQEISEAYRFLAEGAKDSSDDDWQSDSDSGSDYGPRFRFHGGGGTYSYVDPDDDLLLFFLLSQMFENRRGPTSASYSRGDSGRTRYKPSTQYRTPTREKSPTVEAKQAPSYEVRI